VRNVGLLGGSFDPVHSAHIGLARAAYRCLQLDQVQLIPAANPWQRAPLTASSDHRLAMLKHASKEYSWLHINPIEIQRADQSYTADTLQQLPRGPHYFWIMGSDQLQNFCTWYRWQAIIKEATLAVAQRPGSQLTLPAALRQEITKYEDDKIVTLDFPPTNLSATQIRSCLAAGERLPTDALHPDVFAYIKAHGLYQPSDSRS